MNLVLKEQREKFLFILYLLLSYFDGRISSSERFLVTEGGTTDSSGMIMTKADNHTSVNSSGVSSRYTYSHSIILFLN